MLIIIPCYVPSLSQELLCLLMLALHTATPPVHPMVCVTSGCTSLAHGMAGDTPRQDRHMSTA